ncbi:MAG: protein translocase subunit SecF [Actinomycetota bacterium]
MRFDFIGRKKIWFALSGVIILIGFLALIFRGLNFGIEFKGGTLFDIKFAKPVGVYQVRKELRASNLGGSTIQPTGKNEVLIRCRSLSSRQQQKVIKALDEKFGIKDRSIQNVGPGWGGHITRAALIALVLCLCGLLLYIGLRFEFKMAVTAITALFHDILITMGIYALVGRVITPNTVAALLTILGYSLYDTIVVYHKIVENTPKMSKQTYAGMVNDSINQVLARSINTSLTTLFPIICLLLIGGETLKDFAFVLFIGLTSAAYSSIFTASPLLTLWKETEPRYRSLKAKYGR